jgi:hypothetical protein
MTRWKRQVMSRLLKGMTLYDTVEDLLKSRKKVLIKKHREDKEKYKLHLRGERASISASVRGHFLREFVVPAKLSKELSREELASDIPNEYYLRLLELARQIIIKGRRTNYRGIHRPYGVRSACDFSPSEKLIKRMAGFLWRTGAGPEEIILLGGFKNPKPTRLIGYAEDIANALTQDESWEMINHRLPDRPRKVVREWAFLSSCPLDTAEYIFFVK